MNFINDRYLKLVPVEQLKCHDTRDKESDSELDVLASLSRFSLHKIIFCSPQDRA